MLVLSPAFLFFAAIALPIEQANAQPAYDIPVANGVPVDGCATWQANCGQAAADQFCRAEGYAGASSWSWAHDLRTWNLGSNRYCDRETDRVRCGGLRLVVCAAAAGGATNGGTTAVPIDAPSLLVSTAWSWIDSGNTLGTMTFYANGTASATWINVSQQWRIDANGDLMVYADGTRWVTRLRYDPDAGKFRGSRDATSQTQDGITTELQPAR
jgi:hypothetical protein